MEQQLPEGNISSSPRNPAIDDDKLRNCLCGVPWARQPEASQRGERHFEIEQFSPNRQRKEDFYMKIDAIKDFKVQLL